MSLMSSPNQSQPSAARLILLSALIVACKPTGTSIERSQVRGQEAAPVGSHSPLAQPSDSLREACSQRKNSADCSQLPWSVPFYNELARIVDASNKSCSHLYVRAGQSATLRSEPHAGGTPVITLFAGTELLASSLGQHKTEFVQVRYRDNLGISYGNTAASEAAVFVDRQATTCEIPAAQNEVSKNPSSPTSTGTFSSHLPTPISKDSNPPSASPQFKPAKPDMMQCMAIVPLHAKLLIWAAPKCKDDDGKVQDLSRGSMVVVGTRPEPGTPVSYWEVNRQCRILAENLDLERCQQLAR